jgi:hypothetical protein
MPKFNVIEKCAICDKRLGRYKLNGKPHAEMKVIIDNMCDDNFKAYNACGHCAIDRFKQRRFELKKK